MNLLSSTPPLPPTALGVDDEAAKKKKRRDQAVYPFSFVDRFLSSGFAKTLLTGNTEPMQAGKKRLLGGSTGLFS